MMSGLIEILKNYCLSLPTKNEDAAREILKGIVGRGGYGPKLVDWLERSRAAFPETVRIEYPENINDRGVDVYIEAQQSRVAVGFQIKSDNDLRDGDFLPNLKRQITEARAYANLKLYVIVLACSPHYYHKVQYALNEELNQWQAGVPEILLLVPGKAASLYEAFNRPLTTDDIKALLRDRSWHRFFAEVAADRDDEFLNHWSNLNPDERFAPPDNLDRIERSLSGHPLTVIAGPPTIGKTFTAVQLLYRHFRMGRPVEWIKPPGQNVANFIVAPAEASEGFTFRVRQMARRLGMRPPDLPRNRWEFIAARLQPGALILIEDPFGRTDAEYQDSIHTYDFFDLEGCVEAILKEGIASGCRLLITTRHGLLDRWLAQRRGGSLNVTGLPIGVNIIHLGPANYDTHSTTAPPLLFDLAERLLQASQKADESRVAEWAEIISKGAKTPQEVELIIGALPTPVNKSAVYSATRNTPIGALERISALCRATNDGERLFLFMLMLTGDGYDHNDFASVYRRLHTAMLLPGKAQIDDAAARAKYWLLYYPHDYTTTNTLFTSRGTPLQWGVHLTASHPSVAEAARMEIIQNGHGFLNHLAEALPRLQGYRTAEEYRKILVDFLIGFLIDESRHIEEPLRLDERALKNIASVLPSTIKPSYSMYRDPVDRLLRHWTGLPPTIQAALVQTIREADSRLAAWACHLFRYMAPAFDPWLFYDILVEKKHPTLGVNEMVQPWHHFVSYIDRAPLHLRQLFDSMAASKPSTFSYVIGELASSFWERFPEQWKSAIVSDHSANSIWRERPLALKKIYSGLFDGDVSQPPSELLDLLSRYLDHRDEEFRTAAGTYILIYSDRLAARFRKALTQRFRTETNLLVLMRILYEGISSKNNAYGLSLAEIVLERCNDVTAAWLMGIIREKNRGEFNPQNSAFIERCRDQAGPYSRAFELPDFNAATVHNQPELVQVAWIWKQVTGNAPHLGPLVQIEVPMPGEAAPASLIRAKADKPDPLATVAPFIRDIARGLHGSFALCAHYILGHQVEKLPSLLTEYLTRVETGELSFTEMDTSGAKDISKQVREAVVSGRRDHQEEVDIKRQTIPAFPIHTLGAALRDGARD